MVVAYDIQVNSEFLKVTPVCAENTMYKVSVHKVLDQKQNGCQSTILDLRYLYSEEQNEVN
jgi:hypothetical protein